MNSEILLGDDGRKLFKAVDLVYDYLNPGTRYRFTDIDLSKQTIFEGIDIPIATAGGTFKNDYIEFVHGAANAHTFTITYKTNINIYDAIDGTKIAEKQANTSESVNLVNLIGNTSEQRHAFFVPANIA